ncbi:MAG TPA: nicotinate (nicotinamide) nucleotide adenylyltransferase [Candidatus Saccharimonadales bacterium]|nr:nicotinate (nicotinamide) nucleotide adenylyltransferase [Candidatus Saccharimonadales bacterium]
MTRIGLLFGSFNPVHKGHLAVARAALAQADCDEVWLFVQYHNKYKGQDDLLSIDHRLVMTRLATSSDNKIKVLPGASDMITTLGILRKSHSQFALLMGQDLVASLPQWPDGEKILQEYHIYYYPRRHNLSPADLQHPHVHLLEAAGINISSAEIRQCLAQGHSITNLVPPPVAAYIQAHRLYSPTT